MAIYPLSELKAKIIYKSAQLPARIIGLNQKTVEMDRALSASEWENYPEVTIYLHVCGEWKNYSLKRLVISNESDRKATIVWAEGEEKSFARGLSVARSFSSEAFPKASSMI